MENILKVTLGVLVVLALGIGSFLVVGLVAQRSSATADSVSAQPNQMQSSIPNAVYAKITEEDAKKIALGAVEGKVVEVSAKKVNGIYAYEVEIQTEKGDAEVLVNLMNGKVERIEQGDDENEPPVSTGARITEQQARKIAIEMVGGVVSGVETDRINNRDAWEVELKRDGQEGDVLIDMETGAILSVEWETEDDESEDEDDD